MNDIKEKLKCCIMSVSLQRRKTKELKQYKKEVKRIKKMDEDEVDLEYIKLKAQYEYKKNLLSIFICIIFFSFFGMNVWRHVYHSIETTELFITSNKTSGIETAQVIFAITVILSAFIMLLILILLIAHTKRMHQIYKELLKVEENRNKRYR